MREVVCSAAFMTENTGVIPLPAANATTSSSVAPRTKAPNGLLTSMRSPSRTVSFSRLDTTPPGTRLIVTCRSASVAGDDDIE